MDDFQAKLQALSQRVGDKPLSNKSSNPAISPDNEKEVLFYETDDGDITISVFFYKETFWLTQKSISELFDTSKQNISYHLQNIFSDGELDKDSVVKEFLTTAADAKNYLDVSYKLQDIWENKEQHNKDQQEYLDKIGLEISRMKEGSIALVNQITTISKMRIFDPRNLKGVLTGISLSEENMEKINQKMKELYIF